MKCVARADGTRVYYAMATPWARATCRECVDSDRDTIRRTAGYAAIAMLVPLLLIPCLKRRVSKKLQDHLRGVWLKFTPQVKLKIVISFYMIATRVDKTYDVELPPSVRRMLDSLGFAVSFGLTSVGRVLQCLDLGGHYNALILYILLPLAIALLWTALVAIGLLRARALSIASLRDFAIPGTLWVGFVAYPIVTNVAFESFSCYEFEEGDWLKVDVAIECGSSVHDALKRLAWLAILIYPVGLLVVNATLLFAYRNQIQQRSSKRAPMSAAIAFLYKDYKPQMFWWELVEMARRLTMVGFMVLPKGMMQLLVGTVLAAAFLLFQVQTSPYMMMSDDFLAGACSFSLVVVFLCSFVFKYSALIEQPNVQAGMTASQKGTYTISPFYVSLLMVGCVLGVLLLSFVIFLVQYFIERARLRREMIACKARRLRKKETFEAIAAPPLHEGEAYHLFLSHVWGTGQDQMRIVKQRLLEMIPDLAVFLDVDGMRWPAYGSAASSVPAMHPSPLRGVCHQNCGHSRKPQPHLATP